MRVRILALTLALAMGLAIPGTSGAALLGLTLDFPKILFNNQGSLTYSALTDTLLVQATPLSIRLAPADPPIVIVPDATFGGGLFIAATVDDAGLLVGGVPGDDLAVFGEVDLGPLGFFSGLLLTGEVTAFGFQDSGGTTDFYDFKFTPTGGQLAFLFPGGEIGVDVTSEMSTFLGTFTMTVEDEIEFDGQAKGTLGNLPEDGGAGQGCTPGFWKQPHHFNSWVGFSPDDLFQDVFGVPVPGTLLEALEAKGGGLNALLRHTVAALLNASNPSVNPDVQFNSTGEVIAAFVDAFIAGDFETLKDLFEASNEAGCRLGNGGGPASSGKTSSGKKGKAR